MTCTWISPEPGSTRWMRSCGSLFTDPSGFPLFAYRFGSVNCGSPQQIKVTIPPDPRFAPQACPWALQSNQVTRAVYLDAPT
jgi:hypothetical protein